MQRRLLVIWSLLVMNFFSSPLLVFSASAIRDSIVFTQPDGTSFSGTLHGDEWFYWIETEDGQMVQQNKETRFYEYASIRKSGGQPQLSLSGIIVGGPASSANVRSFRSATGSSFEIDRAALGKIWKKNIDEKSPHWQPQSQTRSQRKKAQPIVTPGDDDDDDTCTDDDDDDDSCADDIKRKMLVILVEFSDYNIDSSISTWQDKIFGSKEGQLNDYYDEVSQGTFQFKAAKESFGSKNDGMVKVKLDRKHPNSGQDNDHDVLIEAMKAADAFVNFSEFDANNNGEISSDELQIMFIMAGGESAYGDEVGVWAHSSCLVDSFLRCNPLSALFNDCAPDLDSIEVLGCGSDGGYARFGERHGNHDATIGIMAHELGHSALGLPDLYDVDESSAGVGNWDVMGSGSWGKKDGERNAGTTPVHFSAWSKLEVGFADVEEIDFSGTVQFEKNNSRDYVIYKFPTPNRLEYFLAEYRPDDGYDQGLRLQGGPLKEGLLFGTSMKI